MTGSNDGKGVHFLWHLEQVGCIKRAVDTYEPTDIWARVLGEELRASKVAIIDNGCSLTHPNLRAADAHRPIIAPMEFAGYIEGAVYNDDPDDLGDTCATERFKKVRTVFEAMGISDAEKLTAYLGDGISSDLHDVIQGYFSDDKEDKKVRPRSINLPSPSERFAAHGTACAGLIAARPEPEPADDIPLNPSAIGYFGVNPFAQIIPIATVYSHAYWPMVMALIYAAAQEPDVILIPRAIEEMEDPEFYATHEGSGSGYDADPRDNGNLRDPQRWAEKQLFEKLLCDLSTKYPIVVAAGNSGRATLEYPAKLVNHGAPDLIVVGAATVDGKRATYSSGYDPKAASPPRRHRVTVYASADDREQTNADDFRAFDLAWRSRRVKLDAFDDAAEGAQAKAFEDFAPYGVLSIDIAGQYGYDAASPSDFDFREDRIDEDVQSGLRDLEALPRALYTLFGGTSAASAVVAGVVSVLKAMTKGADLDGAATKALLERVSADALQAVTEDNLARPRTQRSTARSGNGDDALPGVNLVALAQALEGVETPPPQQGE